MTYSYRTFDMLSVIEITDALANIEPGAYLSDDQPTRYFLATLDAGYRWVRTENGLAIFEKQEGSDARDRLILGMADRIMAQAELLSRRALKPRNKAS